MIKTLNVPLVGARRHGPPPAARGSRRPGGEHWLVLVAAAFTLAQLVLVRPGMGLGWDETVYVSQISPHAPAAFFSAPRARGVPLLVTPIASWSSSTTLLRVYLALLSGLGLFLALRVWRGLFPIRVLASAGALFATLWVTLFYGPQAMPNYWVAIGALAGVGCYLFMIGYAAPRFLLPVYALLAIPVADALVHLVTAPGRAWRPVAVTLVALGLAGHLAVQFAVLQATVQRTTVFHRGWASTAAELHRFGVRAPCLLTGHQAVPIAFYAGCSSAATSGHNANTTPSAIVRAGQREPVAVVTTPAGRPPAYARDWAPHRAGDLRVYVAPGAGGGTV